MHDIGKVALELLKPQEYRRAIAEVAPPRAGECRDAETRHCGVDHTAVGEMLAERWSLPAGIRAAIRYHHDSGAMASVPTPIKRIVAIVKAADVVSTRCGYGSSEDVNPLTWIA